LLIKWSVLIFRLSQNFYAFNGLNLCLELPANTSSIN
jgi:hypothetical protein